MSLLICLFYIRSIQNPLKYTHKVFIAQSAGPPDRGALGPCLPRQSPIHIPPAPILVSVCFRVQICLVFTLATILLSLCFTSFGSRLVSFAFRAGWGPAVDWYDFSHPSLFVFYVYSAFLVESGSEAVIRLISISSPVETFARYQTEVFCVVRRHDGNTSHVASILLLPPRRITEPGRVAWYSVADYVYSCPVPRYRYDQVPVSIQCLK